jgi:hypothetical protein
MTCHCYKFWFENQFFKPLENFKLKTKRINYFVYQKLITIIMSIAIGYEYMKDINKRPAPGTLATNIFEMNNDNIEQLKDIHRKTLTDNSNSILSTNMVVIDIDQ